MENTKIKYLEDVIGRAQRRMEKQERENPVVKLSCELVSQAECGNKLKTEVRVIKTSVKIKLKSLVEETLHGEDAKGTVIDSYDNVLVLLHGKRFQSNRFVLTRDINYNDVILLRETKNFIASLKCIPECLYSTDNVQCSMEKMRFATEGKTADATEEMTANGQQKAIADYHNQALNEQQKAIADYHNQTLNEQQKTAVNWGMMDFSYKILGPPGTGKTETLTEVICQLLQKGRSVLVCGPSNISIDNLISRLLKTEYYQREGTNFYRLGSSFKGLVEWNLENQVFENIVPGDSKSLKNRLDGKRNKLEGSKSKAGNKNKTTLRETR